MKMNTDQLCNFIKGCDDLEVLKTLTEKLQEASENVLPSLRKFLNDEDSIFFRITGDEPMKIGLNFEREE